MPVISGGKYEAVDSEAKKGDSQADLQNRTKKKTSKCSVLYYQCSPAAFYTTTDAIVSFSQPGEV